MTSTLARLSTEQFSAGAQNFIRSLRDAFIRDEDLIDDLDAVLGETAGPTGLAGARRQRRPRGRRANSPMPTVETPPDLCRAITRLDRMLAQLVAIAQDREWEFPYPTVAAPIARANGLRAQRPQLTGELVADRTHLRRLALVALELLDALSDDTEEVPVAGRPRVGGSWA